MTKSNIIRGAGITIDLALRSVSTSVGQVKLTRTEYDILAALVGRTSVMPHNDMIAMVYPEPDLEPEDPYGVVKAMVCKLRRRLKDAGAPDVIGLSWGVGYYFTGHRATS